MQCMFEQSGRSKVFGLAAAAAAAIETQKNASPKMHLHERTCAYEGHSPCACRYNMPAQA